MNSLDTPLFIKEMLTPGFYPHPVKTPIRLIQTHISWIILTGDFTYKIKKSVNFHFLDFSTLEKRKFFLWEELRLNQLISPEIYLEILPITKENNHHCLAGTGLVVEYALKMREFAQESLLINLGSNNQLSELVMNQLGKKLSDFHKKTKFDWYIGSFGELDKIKKYTVENWEGTTKYLNILQSPRQFKDIVDFNENFWTKNSNIFQERIQQEKIRECHGDLHLKNICYWENHIYLFDRIEFNEQFRYVDVIYDVAFLLMDLEVNGCSALGNVFLNTYLENTGDWEGVQLLQFYLSRQAYVRAKVASYMTSDPQVDIQTKQNNIIEAKKYYQASWQYTQTQKTKLIIMSGLSGSGKTTTAKQLAMAENAIHIRSDAIRKQIAGINLTEKGNEEIYTKEMTEKTYDKLIELAQKITEKGKTVILDAKFDTHRQRSKAIALSKSHKLPLEIIYCHGELEVLRSRLKARIQDISDASEEILEKQQTNWQPFNEEEKNYLKKII